jgi:hypothetical protein
LTVAKFCDDEENEFHLFIRCPRIDWLWIWLYDFVLRHYDNVISNDLKEWEKLIGCYDKMPRTLSQVWKIFHAETIRAIWASRCRLVFDGELMQHEELQAQIISRVEYAMTIWANLLQSSSRQRNRKILKKMAWIWTVTIPIASFEKSGKGFWPIAKFDFETATCKMSLTVLAVSLYMQVWTAAH